MFARPHEPQFLIDALRDEVAFPDTEVDPFEPEFLGVREGVCEEGAADGEGVVGGGDVDALEFD